MRTVVTASIEINDRELRIDGYVHYHVDNNYGADADGKRGEKRTIVEDVTTIQAYDADLNDVPLSPEDLNRAAEILTREFLEE